MTLYHCSLTAKSALAGPVRGGILWGQLCWALRESQGEKALTDFLESYRQGPPPLAIGDAFPRGWLPRPCLPPLSSGMRKKLRQELAAGEAHQKVQGAMKKAAKTALVPAAWLRKKADKPITEADLTRKIYGLEPPSLQGRTALQPHVSLSRISLSARQGQLYADEIHLYPHPEQGGPQLDLYFYLDQSATLSLQELAGLLRLVGLNGYGRDASTGRGALEFGEPEPLSWKAGEKANALLALGAFAPHPEDPIEGWWQTETHYGRVGNHYAAHQPAPPDGGHKTPFKKPQLLLKPGSLFLGKSPVLGRLLENVHRLPQVCSAAFCPVLPLMVEPEKGESPA